MLTFGLVQLPYYLFWNLIQVNYVILEMHLESIPLLTFTTIYEIYGL